MTDSQKLDLLLEKTISIEGDITSMKSDIGSIQNEITSMKSDIGSIQNEIASMKSDIGSIQNEIASIKSDMPKLKIQVLKIKAELKGMDELILDEVERVHTILNKHMENKTVHTA